MAGWSRDVSFRFLCSSLARLGASFALRVGVVADFRNLLEQLGVR